MKGFTTEISQLFKELIELMARLRGPDGCPWDKKQDHSSIKPYLVEEAYEVLETIDEQDPEKLKEKLGDLLLQVIFHCQMASEKYRRCSFLLERKAYPKASPCLF